MHMIIGDLVIVILMELIYHHASCLSSAHISLVVMPLRQVVLWQNQSE